MLPKKLLRCVNTLQIMITVCGLQLYAQSLEPRAKHPTIINFDPPGSIYTYSEAINPAGAIAGFFLDASNVLHGFLRTPDGTFTTFDAPRAGTSAFQGTTVWSINPAGVITGWYGPNSKPMATCALLTGRSLTSRPACASSMSRALWPD